MSWISAAAKTEFQRKDEMTRKACNDLKLGTEEEQTIRHSWAWNLLCANNRLIEKYYDYNTEDGE